MLYNLVIYSVLESRNPKIFLKIIGDYFKLYTEPMRGLLFVHIWLDCQTWIQIWQWKIEFRKFVQKSENVCLSSAFNIRERGEEGKVCQFACQSITQSTFAFVFLCMSVTLSRDNRTRELETNYRSLLYYRIWTYYARCGCVFIRETQNLPHNVSKQDYNDTFPKHMGLYQTEYNFNAIV